VGTLRFASSFSLKEKPPASGNNGATRQDALNGIKIYFPLWIVCFMAGHGLFLCGTSVSLFCQQFVQGSVGRLLICLCVAAGLLGQAHQGILRSKGTNLS
jgi:hypothetical protein